MSCSGIKLNPALSITPCVSTDMGWPAVADCVDIPTQELEVTQGVNLPRLSPSTAWPRITDEAAMPLIVLLVTELDMSLTPTGITITGTCISPDTGLYVRLVTEVDT